MVRPPKMEARMTAMRTAAPPAMGRNMRAPIVAMKIPNSRQPAGVTDCGRGSRYSTARYRATRANPLRMRRRRSDEAEGGAATTWAVPPPSLSEGSLVESKPNIFAWYCRIAHMGYWDGCGLAPPVLQSGRRGDGDTNRNNHSAGGVWRQPAGGRALHRDGRRGRQFLGRQRGG